VNLAEIQIFMISLTPLRLPVPGGVVSSAGLPSGDLSCSCLVMYLADDFGSSGL
jgi:hypothetical protein